MILRKRVSWLNCQTAVIARNRVKRSSKARHGVQVLRQSVSFLGNRDELRA